MRADLDRGPQAAQIAHAAGESSPGNLPPGTNVVVLTTPDEAGLEVLARRLTWAGVAFVRIEEPDAPHNGALMALGCVPARQVVVRRHGSSLPLLR